MGVYLTEDLRAGQVGVHLCVRSIFVQTDKPNLCIWSRVLIQEVTANYGYMEKYLATEAGIQMMLTVGQAVAGIQDKGEFHR